MSLVSKLVNTKAIMAHSILVKGWDESEESWNLSECPNESAEFEPCRDSRGESERIAELEEREIKRLAKRRKSHGKREPLAKFLAELAEDEELTERKSLSPKQDNLERQEELAQHMRENTPDVERLKVLRDSRYCGNTLRNAMESQGIPFPELPAIRHTIKPATEQTVFRVVCKNTVAFDKPARKWWQFWK